MAFLRIKNRLESAKMIITMKINLLDNEYQFFKREAPIKMKIAPRNHKI